MIKHWIETFQELDEFGEYSYRNSDGQGGNFKVRNSEIRIAMFKYFDSEGVYIDDSYYGFSTLTKIPSEDKTLGALQVYNFIENSKMIKIYNYSELNFRFKEVKKLILERGGFKLIWEGSKNDAFRS